MKITNHNKQITNKLKNTKTKDRNIWSLVIRSLVIVCLLVLGNWIFMVPAFALSINIDPSNIKVVIKPGGSKSGEIMVRNTGSSSLKLKAYTEDWVYAPDGSKNFIKAGSSVYSCSNWITLDVSTFELSPKSEKKVSYTINAPKNTSGGHVSVIFFEGLLQEKEGIAVSGRIGTIVYQDTEGDIKRNGEISNISILTSEEGKPIDIKISLLNKGNSYISAKPEIRIEKDKNIVSEPKIRNINTLPGDTGTGIVSISKLIEGKYKVFVELSYDNKILKANQEFTVKKISSK